MNRQFSVTIQNKCNLDSLEYKSTYEIELFQQDIDQFFKNSCFEYDEKYLVNIAIQHCLIKFLEDYYINPEDVITVVEAYQIEDDPPWD